jgi:predicted AlkP superfamily phosphohydrolase/phosphomutase
VTKKIVVLSSLCLLLLPNLAFAYIGPGAGFAFLGSAFVFILTIGLAILTILFWPLQLVWRKLRRRGIPKAARARRVVILGLDGLEPKLVESLMQQGKLPNMAKLKEQGAYSRLGTTLPALSPVAWSTFQTGVNPGAHNIFDFLTRDKRYCLPLLSSTETSYSKRRFKLGPIAWNLKDRAEVKLLRKSKPFWKLLGDRGIFSNIIRVPISYPPEKFAGNILSAMCTPDLRGTQGTFSFYTTSTDHLEQSSDGTTGGEVKPLVREGSLCKGVIVGPPNPKQVNQNFELPFSINLSADKSGGELKIGEFSYALKLDQLSDWIPVEFDSKLNGIARFCLRQTDPECALYVSPINVNPESPVLPISEPVYFSTWLAKSQGLFGTLGMLEDTWGRNELALDDARFLEQAYLTHDEREKMFFEVLNKTREGLCCCVFDASDRIQHMFWRYLDAQHPSPLEGEQFKDTIPEMYQNMDKLVGKTMAALKPNDTFIVLSDHGFASFRRCIGLNAWLYEQGYLALKDGAKPGRDYFQDVDWSKTKAFAVGLSGIYINRIGREVNGIVNEQEAQKIKAEISAKLEQLCDPKDGARTVSKVYDTAEHYRGVYAKDAPDLIIGYFPGYRVSWDSVTGTVEQEIFSDNLKAWSGDHHVDPALIPGIFFINKKKDLQNPHIADIAPTVLDLFAVPIPRYMEGKVLA